MVFDKYPNHLCVINNKPINLKIFTKVKAKKIELKWAIIYSAMFLLWVTMEKTAGLHGAKLSQHQLVNSLILIPSFIMYAIALVDKKRSYYSGIITFKQSFKSGLLLSLFIVLLSPVYQYISFYIISPSYFKNMITYTVGKGVLTQVQAAEQFTFKAYLLAGAIAGMITGIIFSIIISFFIKTKK